MICPKCGFEQPDNPECMRCGVIVGRYKGPALGDGALRPPVPPPPPSLPLSANETVRVAFEPTAPVAMAAAGGTVYGGPPPATADGGTVYGGPAPGAVRPPSFGVARGDVGVGDLLSQTFSIYFANFMAFVLLAILALSPLFIIQGVSASAKAASPLAILSGLVLFLGSIFCPYLATGAITYGVFQQLREKDTSIGDCLRQGLSALPRVLGVSFVQGILVFLAALACLVPAVILSLRWAVSVPTAVTERTGASESMSRSTFLTEGFRGEVFGFLCVLFGLNVGLILLTYLATLKNPTLYLLLSDVVTVFTTGLSATGAAVLYYRLRSVKESIDVDQIASVFA